MDELHYCVARAESQPARIEGRTGERWIVKAPLFQVYFRKRMYDQS